MITVGDYKTARCSAKRIASEGADLTPEEKEKVERVLKITGIDPWVVGGFLFTFGVLVFLFIKYVL